MGLRQRLQAAMRAFKANPAIVDRYEVVYGHDESTFSPQEYGEYLVTSNAVFACSTLRSDMLASIPLKAFGMHSGKKTEVLDGPVVDMLTKVNPYWTMNRLMQMSEMSLCLWGKAYWAVERGPNGRGMPREIWWMRPDRVKVYPDAKKYIRGFEYQPADGSEGIWFDPWEIVWFRYPNPLDEYGGLSPLAAARIAADLASAAAKSNKYLFEQGYQLGGVVTPKNGQIMTKEQAEELERSLDRRFKGVDKAHRWGVFRFEAEMKQMNISPKDAEFLGTLTWSLEEVARAYKVPLDMIGGQRTYENVQAAERAFWYRTMEPESRFIASEIVEQLLPMFSQVGVDLVEFDLSRVPILQDAEGERWRRAHEQIQVGAITVNQWRNQQGLEPVRWGDGWWAPMTLAQVKGGTAEEQEPTEEAPRGVRATHRGIELGSAEHERIWKRYERRATRWEEQIGEAVRELFERQRESVIARLKAGRSVRREEEIEPFDRPEWVKKFRIMIRQLLVELVEEFGNEALDGLGLTIGFLVKQPAVQRFIEQRAQRFAQEVNETTWNALRESLSEGIGAGEELPKLIERVEDVMGERIRSSGEVIARTEVVGASNGGTLEGWRQSGIKVKKGWLSALMPGRTRDTHADAHARYQAHPIPLDENFEVGAGAGPHPGAIGLAEEDINCLCTMTAEVEE